jgi:D-glycero-beta-D-manno-heptose 1-phosphate adenylyltransferase
LSNSQDKIIHSPERLADILPTLERPLVFTNGCFDILHRGHIAYLEEAAALGKTLIVAVNTDASVKRLDKGSNRPLNSLNDRMAVLAALASVGRVIAFDEDTPIELIRKIRPQHLVKGGDWPIDQIVGSDVVTSYHGEVHAIPVRYPTSTSELIEKIRKTPS